MSKRAKVWLGVLLILGAIGGMALNGVRAFGQYYYTIEELARLGPRAQGKSLRVNGAIVAESVRYDLAGPLLTFKVRGEEGGELTIAYRGVKPDNFANAVQAIAEGRINERGVFEADKLMMVCPSKYESRGN